MTEQAPMRFDSGKPNHSIRNELIAANTTLNAVTPVLSHLIVDVQNTFFNDQILAATKGMVVNLAAQLESAAIRVGAGGHRENGNVSACEELQALLLSSPSLLTHCHATAIEGILTEHLHKRAGVDRILSPMINALMASDQTQMSGNAMAVLSAQAQFIQQQRRMELPLAELPGKLFHEILSIWMDYIVKANHPNQDELLGETQSSMRSDYNASESRLDILNRTIAGMGIGAKTSLSIGHAGVALFTTALAQLSGQERATAILSTNERQTIRFALALRAGGLDHEKIDEQLGYLHSDYVLSWDMNALSAKSAKELLLDISAMDE